VNNNKEETMTETTTDDAPPTMKQMANALLYLAFLLIIGAWLGAWYTSHHRTGSISDADVHNLKMEAFSPVDQAATFGDIANKCMALTGDSQRGAKTDAEKVRLAERGTTCLSFVVGFLDGYNAGLMARSDLHAAFCIPPEVNTKQILKAFLTAAFEHPEQSQEDGAAALQAVLVNAYPCKDADNKFHSIVSP
jgi:Rap1a immunity proteins